MARGRATYMEQAKRAQAEKCATTAAKMNAIAIDHLMKHMDVPVSIPDRVDPEAPPPPQDFVRNVVGSSAGAGSAEYHIYRNNRKKEAARLRYMDKMAKLDDQQKEYDDKREKLDGDAETKTAKKRNKRQKRKENLKAIKDNLKATKKAKRDEEEAADKDKESSESSSDSDS